MRLLLIRHGQIQSNVEGVLDTAVPGPGLTALGRQQAALLPTVLPADEPHAIWVSSAVRAQETAMPLAEARGLTPIARDGLREISAGDYEMSKNQRDVRSYVGHVLGWAGGDLDPRIPGGEDGHDFFGRFDAVVEEVLERGRDRGQRTVAVVSHGAAIRCWASLRADNLGLETAKHYWLDNTGVAVLDQTATGWTCVSWMGDPVTGVGVEAPAGPTGEPVE